MIAFDKVLNPKFRIKAEAYYQHLFNIPIINDPMETFSTLNSFDMWDYFGLPQLVQEGTARNIGLDLTVERFFADQYYFMITGSLYDSKYKNLDGNFYNTRFNGNYQLNVLGGKEWLISKKDRILGVNGKFILAGGARYTPIDLASSIEEDDTVYFSNRPFEMQQEPYHRIDLGVSYKINMPNLSHAIMFDVQNVTNRENLHDKYFNEDTKQIESDTQTGLFPFINYRIEF